MTPEVTVARFPYRVRARWGGVLLAESDRAVLLEETAGERQLCFPVADIRLDRLRDEGRRTTWATTGSARLWSLDPAVASPLGEDEGRDLVRVFDQAASDLHSLRDVAVFDHRRAQVEVVDTVDGEDAKDLTFKRFPTWGDAADLIRIVDVQPTGEHRFSGLAWPDARRPVVEGSQMLGQAIVAAGRLAPGRRPVAASMIFIRGADARRPLEFDLEQLSAGRTFTSFSTRVGQAGRTCAAGTLLLDVKSPDVFRHEVETAPVPGPYESEPVDMSVTGRDVRIADAAYVDDPAAPIGPPSIEAWVRFRSVPDDAALHAGLLAQFTGHLSIAAAMRPHPGVGQRDAHRTLSTAVNAISISLHAEARVDEWIRYHHLSTFAGEGMTHSECRVHREDGGLLASFSVDSMVRGFRDGATAAAADNTAL